MTKLKFFSLEYKDKQKKSAMQHFLKLISIKNIALKLPIFSCNMEKFCIEIVSEYSTIIEQNYLTVYDYISNLKWRIAQYWHTIRNIFNFKTIWISMTKV